MRHLFIKRSTGSDNLLLFLVAAAFSVLATRFYLEIFNYPQIARGEIHLAHAIFGAILLSISNIFLFTFHGKTTRQFGAIIGGLGFGQMIDEVGKFITRDNNYFYQPVPMIIYVTFITLFFAYRYLDRYIPNRPKEIIYDTLEHLEELAEDNLHLPTQKWIEKALSPIALKSHKNYEAFGQSVLGLLTAVEFKSKKRNGYVAKMRSSWQWLDEFTSERRPVFFFLLCVFLVYIVTTLFSTFSFSQIVWHRQFENLKYEIDNRFEMVLIFAQYASQFFSALLMIRGFIYLVRRRRIRALEYFRNGLAVNILITHVFTFYFKQFASVPELIITICMFSIVHNILEEEKS
jgi:hypothetical protein